MYTQRQCILGGLACDIRTLLGTKGSQKDNVVLQHLAMFEKGRNIKQHFSH